MINVTHEMEFCPRCSQPYHLLWISGVIAEEGTPQEFLPILKKNEPRNSYYRSWNKQSSKQQRRKKMHPPCFFLFANAGFPLSED